MFLVLIWYCSKSNHFNITVRVLWLPNQFRKHCRFKQQPLDKVGGGGGGWGEIFNISGKGGEHYMGGLDNRLETMLSHPTAISLWVAIYTFPIT